MSSERRRILRLVPGRGPTHSDSDVFQQVARGDQEAFAQLYDRYCDRVFGVCRRVLRDPSHAEEVAQEVFIEVWRQARGFYPDRGTVATWMMTLAHRRAVDRVRSEQSARDRDERVSARDRAPAFDHVAETVETRFEHDQVRRALAELTDLQREAIELAYYGGNTHREVADLLDTPLGTVKTRLRDGLIRLRDHLEVTT